MRRCACCRAVLDKPENQPIHTSSILGSGGVELCVQCGENEERVIAKAGTNDVPTLLNTYTSMQDFFRSQ